MMRLPVQSVEGFTLVELLVVIAMVGILATVVLASVNPQQRIYVAQSTSHLSDLRQIHGALEAYATAHDGKYPVQKNADNSLHNGWSCNNCTFPGYPVGNLWLKDLVDENYLKSVPIDSLAGQEPWCIGWGTNQQKTGYLYKTDVDGNDYKLLGLCTARGLAASPFSYSTYCTTLNGVLKDPNILPPRSLDPIWGGSSFGYYSIGGACFY